jgi:N,N-dimethylformamidase
VISCLEADRNEGCALMLDGRSGIAVSIGTGTGIVSISVGQPLAARQWYRVWASYDAETQVLTCEQRCLSGDVAGAVETKSVKVDAPPRMPRQPVLLLAAMGRNPTGHFNGKLERPRIFDRCLGIDDLQDVHPPAAARIVADWDFSIDIPGARVFDVSPYRQHAQLVNMPARAMTGSNWNGDEPCWRHAPEQYGAIHFHDDDIHDCGWETDFSLTVPDGLASGVYAMRVRSGDAEDMIPFFVRPPRGIATAPICVLIPTFTYVIYGNHARGNTNDIYRQRVEDWNARPWTADEHREYGLSTYNFHADGSGICHASALRPMITFRSEFLSIPELPSSGLRHFAADTHLFDWLEEKGHNFDVITDHDVHEEGYQALAPYQVLLTCTHPEYHTDKSFDALYQYTRRGGRLMYLGGNGFYWRIAVHREEAGILEIRRGEVGMRAWAAEPGEFFQAFDGNYGGLWRRVGKPPNLVTGIGFSSQGKFESGRYRRMPGSRDPRAAWIFEGVAGEGFGDYGLSGEGAAGYELDRADPRLGTPADAIVIATSEHLPDGYVVVPEDLLSHVLTWNGEPVRDLLRADMVYLERPGGGAVFSVGSITFCGSLSHNGYHNDISRIVDNVLKRFRDGR